ncbi:nucleotide-binding universal stress UspA family protein [Variovorax soli]|uniref:Nucleotide-binding universal stress UspA family protein n=2 Tax=Variovorax soli TaxID=376815 RepID=A0ABU1NE28_9BURK|nr:nucleotide-binding universal stress UspA family protein [Variovorax soli]
MIQIKHAKTHEATLKMLNLQRTTIMFKRILVATDGSELAEKAVLKAIDLATAHKAELTAFTVVRRQPKSYMDGSSGFQAEEIDRVECRRAEQAKTMLKAVEKRAETCGVRVSSETVKSSSVAESIVAAARQHGSDLIVMASHGRTGLMQTLLGSETAQVLAHSDVPVLVLR